MAREIAPALVVGNSKAQRTLENFMAQVVDKANRDLDFFEEAGINWIKTSMTVSPEQLTSTEVE
jgi:hypothetical protein